MICVYSSDTDDFTTNGLAVLEPSTCEVSESINGMWEVNLEHPIDDAGKWKQLVCGNILRVPVPAAPTMTGKVQDIQVTYIYKTTRTTYLYNKKTKGKKIKKLKKGQKVIVMKQANTTRFEVRTKTGGHGYMLIKYLTLDTEATQGSITYGEAIELIGETERLRDQPFRIIETTPELKKVKVKARHIFYDLADNMIKKLAPADGIYGKDVFAQIGSSTLSEHPFDFYSDITETAEDVEWIGKNPVDCMLGDSGFTGLFGGEVYRDWYDVVMTEKIGSDNGVQIREGKNLTGIQYEIDTSSVVTRIMPVGQTKDGDPLYLEGTQWIDSPNHFNDYPHPMWKYLEAENAKVGSKDDNDKKITKEKALKAMKKQANQAFKDGCDLPTVTVSIEFVNLFDTEEYRDYAALQNIYMGDTVHVFVKSLGIFVDMRMTDYTYNCLTKKYSKMTLGTPETFLTGTTVSGRNITSGSVTSSALAVGAVDARVISDDVISTRHLQADSVSAEQLQANSVTAIKIAAESITADKIAAGAITAEKIDTTTLNASIVNATTANFGDIVAGSAELSSANVKHLVAGALNVTDAVGDDVYIDNLRLNNAQMVSATVGSLVVKASDGKYYRIDFDGEGKLTPVEVTLTDGEISSGATSDGKRSIVETSLTVEDLGATNMKAVNALINRLTADMIDVDRLYARSAFIEKLTTTQLFADGGTLTIMAGNITTAQTTADEALEAAANGGSHTYVLSPVLPVESTDAVESPADGDTCMVISGETYHCFIYTSGAWAAHDIDDERQMIAGGDGDTQTYTLYVCDGTDWSECECSTGDVWINTGDNDSSWVYTGAAWVLKGSGVNNINATVNSIQTFAQEQQARVDEIEGKTQYLEVDTDGLHIRAQDASSEMLLSSAAMHISLDGDSGNHYSTFSADYVQFGKYKLRLSGDGGMVFVFDEVTI